LLILLERLPLGKTVRYDFDEFAWVSVMVSEADRGFIPSVKQLRGENPVRMI
jgi:hypothetical protein